jgi:hypothetical protein
VDHGKAATEDRLRNKPGGGASSTRLSRGAMGAISKGLYDEAAPRSANAKLAAELMGITNVMFDGELERLSELGMVDPLDPAAGDVVLESLMMSPGDRARASRNFLAGRALDALIAEGDEDAFDYKAAMAKLTGSAIGMDRDEARAFIATYRPAVAVDDPAITSQF